MPKIILMVIFAIFLMSFQSRSFAEPGSHEHHMHHMAPAIITTVDLETNPSVLKAGEVSKISFFIKDSEGKSLKGLSVSHERILHIIIVSADFRVFAHIHPEDFGAVTPEMLEKAAFSVDYTFPKAGQYLIAVDYAAKDSRFSEQFTLDVAGEPKMGSFKKDLSKKKKFGEYEVELSIEPDDIIAGRESTLSYTIRKNGKKVKDLEPYLAAAMHLAIVPEDMSSLSHTHGEEPELSGKHPSAKTKFGPEIEAHVTFPQKGVHIIFGEIKHEGKVIPLTFTVEAE